LGWHKFVKPLSRACSPPSGELEGAFSPSGNLRGLRNHSLHFNQINHSSEKNQKKITVFAFCIKKSFTFAG